MQSATGYRFIPPDARFPFKALNYTDDFINGTTGEFRITLTSGTNYVIGGFANNNSNLSWGGYQNFTNLQSNLNMSITLYPLTGKRYNGNATTNPTQPGPQLMTADDLTMNKITINVTSEVGQGIGAGGGKESLMGAPLNLYVTYPNGIKIQWLLTGGRGNGENAFPLPQGTGVTLEAFNMRFAPIKLVLNSTQIQTYVLNNASVIPLQMKKFDIRKPRRVPGDMNENTNFTSAVRMKFLKSNSTCSVPNAPSNCVISNANVDRAQDFDPMTSMMLGKTDILITQLTSRGNITIKYVGASLMSTAPPDAQFMDAPTEQSASGARERWRFGSSAPKIYEYALVAMPYNSSVINENAPMRARIPLLYDADGNVIYNRTDITKNTTPSDYSDYDPSWFNGSDVTCSPTDQTGLCFQDKNADVLWMKMMHFSEVGPESEGGLPGAPEITLTNSTAAFNNTWTNSPPARFNFTAVDNDSTTMNCTLFINGIFNSTNTSVLNNTPSGLSLNGTYATGNYNVTWGIGCTDIYNYTASTYTRTFTVDNVNPVVIASILGNTSNTPSLNFTVTDNAATTLACNQTLNGNKTQIGTVTAGAPNISAITGAQGTNYINVTCADWTGNTNTSSTLTFSIDTTPPSVTINSPIIGYNTSATSLTVNYTAIDAISPPMNCSTYLDVALNNTNSSVANNTPFSYSITGLGEQLPHTLNVTCADARGNIGSYQKTFNVDQTKPSIVITTPAQSGIYKSATLNFTASDNLAATMSCNRTVNSVNMTTITVQNGIANVTTPTWAQGTNYVNVTCVDSVGNVNTSATTSFTYDTQLPSVYLNSPASIFNTNSTSVIVNVSATDALSATLSCAIYADGTSQWSNTSLPTATNIQTSITLSEGIHYVNATCTDLATNSNTTTTSTVKVDLTPPTIVRMYSVPSRAYNNTNVTLYVNATDSITSVQSVVLNITKPSGTSLAFYPTLSGGFGSNTTLVNEYGTYSVAVTAYDAVGWSATYTYLFSTAINTTLTYNLTNSTGGRPSVNITIFTPENNGTLNASSSGNATLTMPAGLVTVRISDQTTNVTVDLPVNLTGALSFSPVLQIENASAVAATPTYNAPLLVQTITPNITIYASATLVFNYSGMSIPAGEAYRLRVNKCASYNSSTGACAGSWTELTATIDNTTQTVTATVDSFSTFMLANKTSVCGNSVQETGEECDAGSSGSSTCSASCTTIASSPPPSGGGGSSGSSTSAPPSTIKETKTISSIAPGAAATITISKAELLVSQITIESLVKAANVSFTVEKLDSKPGAITALPTTTGKTYKYLDISSSIASANLSKAKIKFKVETKWITSNNYSTSTVSLNRYSSKVWSKLSTTFLNADANNSYFEAESPGFSTFAITGEKYVPAPVEQPKPPETPVEKPTLVEPTPTALTPVVALISQSDIDAATAGLNSIVPQTDDARTLIAQAKVKITEAQSAFNSNEQAKAKQLIGEANLMIQEAAGLKSVAVSKGKTSLLTILLLLVVLAVGAYAYTSRPQTKENTSKLASLKEERKTIIAMKKNAEKEYLTRKIDNDSYHKMLSDYESKLIDVNTRIDQIEKQNN